MSRYFVTDPPVPVAEFDPATVISDTPPNVIYIRARMDVATRAAVTSELFTLGKDQTSVEARLGSNELALLMHNIVRWEGPDLSLVPCDAAHIRTLDPTEPHIARVLEEIAVRNKARPSPNPKSPDASTSMSAGAVGSNGIRSSELAGGGLSQQLATTTSK